MTAAPMNFGANGLPFERTAWYRLEMLKTTIFGVAVTLIFANSTIADEKRCADYDGKRWCHVDPEDAFNDTITHLRKRFPLPAGKPSWESGIVEVDDDTHKTFVSCGVEIVEGNVSEPPPAFFWIDAKGYFAMGSSAAQLCTRYGIKISGVGSPEEEPLEASPPHCAKYRGKTWCPADKKHAFGTTVAHINRVNPPAKGYKGGFQDIVELDATDHSTFVSCGVAYGEGEQGSFDFVWIDAEKYIGYGGEAAIACRRYGYDVDPGNLQGMEPDALKDILKKFPK